MLIGSGILPPEFFAATKNPFVIGAGAREQCRVLIAIVWYNSQQAAQGSGCRFSHIQSTVQLLQLVSAAVTHIPFYRVCRYTVAHA
jgi:hypothetical protein